MDAPSTLPGPSWEAHHAPSLAAVRTFSSDPATPKSLDPAQIESTSNTFVRASSRTAAHARPLPPMRTGFDENIIDVDVFTSGSDSDQQYKPPLSRRAPRRASGRSSRPLLETDEVDEDQDMEEDDIPPPARAPRGTATKERRRKQNRDAQRSLRIRKNQHLSDLESRVASQAEQLVLVKEENTRLLGISVGLNEELAIASRNYGASRNASSTTTGQLPLPTLNQQSLAIQQHHLPLFGSGEIDSWPPSLAASSASRSGYVVTPDANEWSESRWFRVP